MIQINHYNNQFNNVSPIHELLSDFGETNTDTTHWRPVVSLARASLASGMNSRKQFFYDYPDGKDDGNRIKTFLRSPGLDITEIETAEKRITQIVEDLKDTSKVNKEAVDKYKQALKDLGDAVNKSNQDNKDNQDKPSSDNSKSN